MSEKYYGSRLEELKAEAKSAFGNSDDVWTFDVEDVIWLIEQVETAQAENKKLQVWKGSAEMVVTKVGELSDFIRQNNIASARLGEYVTDIAIEELKQFQKARALLIRQYRYAGTSADLDFKLWKEIEQYLGGKEAAKKALEEIK